MSRLTQKVGKNFEKIFVTRLQALGYKVVRVPNGVEQVGPSKVVRVKSPFDFIVNSPDRSQVWCIDTKTCAGSSLPHSKIEIHQLTNLMALNGIMRCGYIVWFRRIDRVVWFSVNQLKSLKPRSSLTHNHGVVLGSIESFKL